MLSDEHPLILKLERRDVLQAAEREALQNVEFNCRTCGVGEVVVPQGKTVNESTLLLDGFAGRVVAMKSGRRQITALHVVGDFVDLHSFVLKRMDHSIEALTPCRVAAIPHADLTQITERFPHLTRMLWLLTVIDGAIHRAWLSAFGRRSALERTAHLVCELFLRLQVVGKTDRQSFRLPLTQMELSEILGVSSIHLNRVIQELRRGGLLKWQEQVVTIVDWDKLAGCAVFDPTYLDLENLRR